MAYGLDSSSGYYNISDPPRGSGALNGRFSWTEHSFIGVTYNNGKDDAYKKVKDGLHPDALKTKADAWKLIHEDVNTVKTTLAAAYKSTFEAWSGDDADKAKETFAAYVNSSTALEDYTKQMHDGMDKAHAAVTKAKGKGGDGSGFWGDVGHYEMGGDGGGGDSEQAYFDLVDDLATARGALPYQIEKQVKDDGAQQSQGGDHNPSSGGSPSGGAPHSAGGAPHVGGGATPHVSTGGGPHIDPGSHPHPGGGGTKTHPIDPGTGDPGPGDPYQPYNPSDPGVGSDGGLVTSPVGSGGDYGTSGLGPDGVGSGASLAGFDPSGLGGGSAGGVGGGGLGAGGGLDGSGSGIGGGTGLNANGVAGAGTAGGGAGGGMGSGVSAGSGIGSGAGAAGAGGVAGVGRGGMMGGHGGGGDEDERERSTWLTEDDDVWGADQNNTGVV